MRRIFYTTGAAVAVGSMLWVLLAAWLSAGGLISVPAEALSYFPCLAAVFLGSAVHFRAIRTGITGWAYWRAATFIVPLVTVVLMWWQSAEVFAFWKTKDLGVSDWRRLEVEISELASEDLSHGVYRVSGRDLPAAFHVLGGAKDSGSATFKRTGNELEIQVTYGSRLRHWGLLIGYRQPESFEKWSNLRRVGTNTWFFCGSGG